MFNTFYRSDVDYSKPAQFIGWGETLVVLGIIAVPVTILAGILLLVLL